MSRSSVLILIILNYAIGFVAGTLIHEWIAVPIDVAFFTIGMTLWAYVLDL